MNDTYRVQVTTFHPNGDPGHEVQRCMTFSRMSPLHESVQDAIGDRPTNGAKIQLINIGDTGVQGESGRVNIGQRSLENLLDHALGLACANRRARASLAG
jgi:hypothetical protein